MTSMQNKTSPVTTLTGASLKTAPSSRFKEKVEAITEIKSEYTPVKNYSEWELGYKAGLEDDWSEINPSDDYETGFIRGLDDSTPLIAPPCKYSVGYGCEKPFHSTETGKPNPDYLEDVAWQATHISEI